MQLFFMEARYKWQHFLGVSVTTRTRHMHILFLNLKWLKVGQQGVRLG